MKIDFDELQKGLIDVIKGSVKAEGSKIKEFSEKIFEEQKDTIERLAELFAEGKITEEELTSELQDEKVTVENLYLALKVAGKASAQRTTNAVLKFLGDSIVKIVKAVV